MCKSVSKAAAILKAQKEPPPLNHGFINREACPELKQSKCAKWTARDVLHVIDRRPVSRSASEKRSESRTLCVRCLKKEFH